MVDEFLEIGEGDFGFELLFYFKAEKVESLIIEEEDVLIFGVNGTVIDDDVEGFVEDVVLNSKAFLCFEDTKLGVFGVIVFLSDVEHRGEKS